jgi:hypothetical protein
MGWSYGNNNFAPRVNKIRTNHNLLKLTRLTFIAFNIKERREETFVDIYVLGMRNENHFETWRYFLEMTRISVGVEVRSGIESSDFTGSKGLGVGVGWGSMSISYWGSLLVGDGVTVTGIAYGTSKGGSSLLVGESLTLTGITYWTSKGGSSLLVGDSLTLTGISYGTSGEKGGLRLSSNGDGSLLDSDSLRDGWAWNC